MRGQNGWRKLKPINQETADIVGRVVNWTHDHSASFFAKPTRRAFEECEGDVAIVYALKQTETTDIRLMQCIIIRIVARHDSANDLAPATAGREKQRGITVPVERMPFTIQKRSAFNYQRRHPGWIICVNTPWKLDERVTLATRADL